MSEPITFSELGNAQCVSWYHENASVKPKQRKCHSKYGGSTPVQNTIIQLKQNFRKKISVESQAQSGRTESSSHQAEE